VCDCQVDIWSARRETNDGIIVLGEWTPAEGDPLELGVLEAWEET
jgi:hypothetical protein